MNGTFAFDPDGNVIESVYLTPEGHDLKQLVDKFLLGSIPFSQGADDYLDDDTEGKGLLASHEINDNRYTDLEHTWDEGFGYFGAAMNYDVYIDEQIAIGASIDTNGDSRLVSSTFGFHGLRISNSNVIFRNPKSFIFFIIDNFFHK